MFQIIVSYDERKLCKNLAPILLKTKILLNVPSRSAGYTADYERPGLFGWLDPLTKAGKIQHPAGD